MSVYNCYDCNKVLCEDCFRKHNDEKKYQSHLMQLISNSYILNCKFILEDNSPYNRRISDMKCLPNGEVVVAVLGQPELMTFSVRGMRRHFIELKESIWKMDVLDKDTVAGFLKNHSMAIVDIQQNHVHYVSDTAEGYRIGSLIYIENQLFVVNTSGIIVIDMSGSVKRRIKLGFTPHDMCYAGDSQRIYCIDSENSELICIDRNGTIVFTYTDPSMTNLKTLTMDNEGDVLVLCGKVEDNSGNGIKVDSNGKSSEVVITNVKTSRDNCICFHRLTNSVVISVYNEVYIYTAKHTVNV
ncbi:Hypothetical predicted protein [Mytilus galloprovincialis]|uniref:B box-type domain-containing protein n=1 Tax=Mytilus galloprovincialis TaxID=29158 RepID=A0A8B6GM61_MYTGA|nr:Hypothetical predicted protein [Mytilus galloprovincialis]